MLPYMTSFIPYFSLTTMGTSDPGTAPVVLLMGVEEPFGKPLLPVSCEAMIRSAFSRAAIATVRATSEAVPFGLVSPHVKEQIQLDPR